MATLKELRKQRGLTQQALASKLGVTVPSVCNWERGETCPSVAHLYATAKVLGVTVNDIEILKLTLRRAAGGDPS